MTHINPRVIPTLLLKGDGLVKTIKFKKPNYLGDPINAVKLFNEMGVDELVFLDIEATKFHKAINFSLLIKIASECFMPLAYGGGIKDIEDIKKVIQIGFEKVIINTASIKNPDLITQASNLIGSQSVVISIDVKKSFFNNIFVVIESGTKNTKRSPIVHAIDMEKRGAGEIIITSIDHEGMMQGYDIGLIKSIADNVSIPVIASGGAKKLSDFHNAVVNGNASAVAAGSIFVYHSNTKGILINYPSEEELITLFKK